MFFSYISTILKSKTIIIITVIQESYGFKDVVHGNGRSRLTNLVAKSYFLFKIAVDWWLCEFPYCAYCMPFHKVSHVVRERTITWQLTIFGLVAYQKYRRQSSLSQGPWLRDLKNDKVTVSPAVSNDRLCGDPPWKKPSVSFTFLQTIEFSTLQMTREPVYKVCISLHWLAGKLIKDQFSSTLSMLEETTV